MLQPSCIHYGNKMNCGICWCPACILKPNRPCVSRRTIDNHGCYSYPPKNWGIEFHPHGMDIDNEDGDEDEILPFQEVEPANRQVPVPPVPVPVSVEQVSLNFFRRLVFEVGQNQMTQKMAVTLCGINADVLHPLFPIGFAFPTTWEGIEKAASMPTPEYKSYDICTNEECGNIFFSYKNKFFFEKNCYLYV